MEKPKFLKYGGVSITDQECVIRIDGREGKATLYSAIPKWSRKLQRRYGLPSKTAHQGEWVTGAWWEVPASLIVIRGLPKIPDPSRAASRRPLVGRKFLKTGSEIRAAKMSHEKDGVRP